MPFLAFHDVRHAIVSPLRLLVIGGCIAAWGACSVTARGSALDDARQRFEQTEQQLKAAVAAEDAAYRERDTFLTKHFEQLREGASQQNSAAEAEPVPTVNPRWQQLNDKVQHLQAQRESLLERLTPAHPLVISLEDELTQAAAARDAVPQLLVPEPQSTAKQSSPASAAVVAAADEVVARFQQLEERCNAAAQEVDRLDAAHSEAAAQLARAQLTQQRQAAVGNMTPGDSSHTLIWGAAVVGAGLAVLCISRLLARPTRSANGIAKALGLPLLGVVRTRQTMPTS